MLRSFDEAIAKVSSLYIVLPIIFPLAWQIQFVNMTHALHNILVPLSLKKLLLYELLAHFCLLISNFDHLFQIYFFLSLDPDECTWGEGCARLFPTHCNPEILPPSFCAPHHKISCLKDQLDQSRIQCKGSPHKEAFLGLLVSSSWFFL